MLDRPRAPVCRALFDRVKELIALAKAKPNTLHFYSSGSGGMPHLVGEMFKAATGARAD